MHRIPRPPAMHLAVSDIIPNPKTGLMEHQCPNVMTMEEVLISLGWNKNPFQLSVPDLVSICQKCRKDKNLPSAKSLYMHIRIRGLLEELGNYIVPVLVECGSLCDAQQVFDDLPHKNEFSWCSLLKGYFDLGELHHVLDLFEKMQDDGVRKSRHSVLVPLKVCTRLRYVEKGHYVHNVIYYEGLECDIVIGNTLVDMYAKCGLLLEAVEVFHKLKGRDVVSWNALITGYIEQGLIENALESLEKMQMDGIMGDSVTLLCMLKASGSEESIDKGIFAHDTAVKQGSERERYIGNALVDMYIKCGLPEEARKVLDKLPSRDVVAWTALIAGYVDNGFGEEALICFEQMKEDGVIPNAATFLSCLKACSSVGDVARGRAIHTDIPIEFLKTDVSLGNSLIDMYAKCGALHEAQQVFEQLLIRNIISWNALLAGYTEQGYGDDALKYFEKMQSRGYSPDSSTLNCALKACGIIGSLAQSQEMHDMIVTKGLEKASFIGNTLVDIYAKFGLLAEAQQLFDELSLQTVVSWTALIAGYSDHGQNTEALNCLDQMRFEGVPPNPVTSACCLKACTNVGDIEKGQEIHSEVTKRGLLLIELSGKNHCVGFDTNRMRLGNALIDMYGKCGNILNAQKVFSEMPARDLVTWNALITAHSRQGHSEVFNFFDEMKKEGLNPDGITFLSLLSVCSHGGLVSKAQNYFETMTIQFKIPPTIEHYNCMVDIFSRAGQLKEATSMLNKMPYQPTIVAWCSILSACRKWHDVKLGRYAFDRIVKLEKEHAPAFILMFNIYVDAHMWEEASKIEAMMLTWKNQGQAWIEIAGVVHCFTINDVNCVRSKEIYKKLREINQKMRSKWVHNVPYPITGGFKDSLSCGHTEMLAATFGLLNTLDGTPINIKKNLNVCADCHAALEFMSKSEKRVIICKDVSCFHEFKEGKCSCEREMYLLQNRRNGCQ